MQEWLNRCDDPEFWERIRDICGLYLNPPQRALVLSVDEKTAIQAKQPKHPDQTPRAGKWRRREFEYIRHGTTYLHAALHVHTGQVLAYCVSRLADLGRPGRKEGEVRAVFDVRVPMRDGTLLSADVYLPDAGSEFPVLLCRTIYSKDSNPETDGARPAGYVGWAATFVDNGYAVVIQDCRGRYESDGEFQVYLEAEDGYDTIEWLARQDWCDGNVGGFGISNPGSTQTHAARLGSQYLKAVMPIAASVEAYSSIWDGKGVLSLQVAFHHGLQTGRRCMHPRGVALLSGLPPGSVGVGGLEADGPTADLTYIYRRLPLASALDEFGASHRWRAEFLNHPRFDDHWRERGMNDQYGSVIAPAYFVTGWYDFLSRQVISSFTKWRTTAKTEDARRFTRIMIGPWTHTRIGVGDYVKDVDFGSQANVDLPQLHLHWYDQRLKGADTGVDTEAPVQLFVMGENIWRDEQEWPLARTQYKAFFLRSGGLANTSSSDGRLTTEPPESEPPDTFLYDPESPVPTWGGQSAYVETSGPRDRESLERRPDILVYSTDPIHRDVEVTGPVTVVLYASSDSADTDFTAILLDVFPDGRAIHITDGIIRARYRLSSNQERFITPNDVYKYEIELSPTSRLFRSGHRIRIEVSSSDFPRFDRNLNTGGEIGMEAEGRVATQRVFHDAARPSRLILPVIPRERYEPTTSSAGRDITAGDPMNRERAHGE